jgi:TRAP-type C4-dicarboxylate transport system substrate-binding protein
MIVQKKWVVAGAMMLAMLGSAQTRAEETLRAVSGFPPGLIFGKTFLDFVADVNARGKGVVQINVIGGPEAIPPLEQPNAVRNGVVDIFFGPANWYAGTVPEIETLIMASGLTGPEVRKKGGVELLNKIHKDKMGTFFVANFNSGIPFKLYLRNEPKIKADGWPDLTGIRVRSAPIYREFFTDLGAVPVQINIGEVYTALERNTADGTGWPAIGIMDLNWDKFLVWKLEPGFYQVETSILANLAKWNGLSEKARKLVQDVAIEWELKTVNDRAAQIKAEEAEQVKRGIKTLTLQGPVAKAFVDKANQHAWEKIAKRDATHVEALKKIFSSN